MGFTVQRMTTGNSGQKEAMWAVVLDHEHIMFVGSYQQCEQWLDLHDFNEIKDTPKSNPQPATTSGTSGQHRFRAWFNDLSRCFGLCCVRERTMSFLTKNDGNSGAIESVAMAAIVGMMYVGMMLTVWTVDWNRVILSRHFLRTPCATRAAMSGESVQGPEIACDLAKQGS